MTIGDHLYVGTKLDEVLGDDIRTICSKLIPPSMKNVPYLHSFASLVTSQIAPEEEDTVNEVDVTPVRYFVIFSNICNIERH